uniref:Vestigial like family member 3 n=1 Tax=Salmo trutta TaxID=8032 RepID=A0A673XV74_SALTR
TLCAECFGPPQPAEAEYLSSRCVLFTYFHGDIGDVVDEHFSRALSQTSKLVSITTSSHTNDLPLSLTDSVSLSEAQCGSLSSSLWGGGYPSQTSPCLSVHPDFSPSPAAFHAPDSALWTGHVLPQPSLPPTASLPDPWAYSCNPQTSASYTHAHNIYTHTHPHTHMHPHHTHPVIHPHLSHGPGLDPRFSPLLLPGVKTQRIHSGVKIEVEQASPNLPTLTPSAWPATLHTPLDIYDSGKPRTWSTHTHTHTHALSLLYVYLWRSVPFKMREDIFCSCAWPFFITAY